MAGRRPKPTAIKKITGNPGRRKLNTREPQPLHGLPFMPEWLGAFSLAVENWNREGGILDRIGVITEADAGVLAQRSFLYAMIVQLATDIKAEGTTVSYQKVDPLGNEFFEIKSHPKVKQLDAAMKEYRACGNLLGLDPSSRSKLKVDLPGEADPMEAFLKNGAKLEVVKK